MTPKPDARLLPTQEEFDAWVDNPVTRFVAASFEKAAEAQRAEWARCFDGGTGDLALERLKLKTREDAYRAFLETTLDRHISIVTGDEGARPVRATQGPRLVPKAIGRAGRSAR